MTRRITPGRAGGEIEVPGSRSITARALVVASLAGGVSHLEGVASCDDSTAMINGLRAIGVDIEQQQHVARVDSRSGLHGGNVTVWAAQSGTTARFLTAIAALCTGDVRIDGEERLRNRPLQPLIECLRTMGAHIDRNSLPIVVDGASLRGGRVQIDASLSSQFVSALAMIGPALTDGLEVTWDRLASAPFIGATAEVMRVFGVDAELGPHRLFVPPGATYAATTFSIPPDSALAVYPALAAAITGGRVRIAGIVRDTLQPDQAVFDVFARMGCEVQWGDRGVTVTGPSRLRGIDEDMSGAPDGALVVAVAAAFAGGVSRLTGLETLSLKESDRLSGLAEGLRSLGAGAEYDRTSLTIQGPVRHGGIIEAHDDHRMAMVFSCAGLAQPGIIVRGDQSVSKTWPGFYEDMEAVAGTNWAPTARVSGAMNVIAIDGPGGSGKTTVSRALARALGLAHLDTGAFYRAVTLEALRTGAKDERLETLARDVDIRYENGRVFIGDEDVSQAIRSDEVNGYVSVVSAVPAVRAEMVRRQRQWVEAHGGNAVVEGRDIGTVVFPDARLKVFLIARPEVRALRRAGEMRDAGVDSVQEDLARRDKLDSSRAVSPLTPAEHAIVVDTSDLSVDQVVAQLRSML